MAWPVLNLGEPSSLQPYTPYSGAFFSVNAEPDASLESKPFTAPPDIACGERSLFVWGRIFDVS